jgi:hypothetical protein
MSRWIRLSSLQKQIGVELDQVGLTEEGVENLIANGEIQGSKDMASGELLVDYESICTYLNSTSPEFRIDISTDESDFEEEYYNDDFQEFY